MFNDTVYLYDRIKNVLLIKFDHKVVSTTKDIYDQR